MVDIIGTGSLNAGFALISVGSESIRHLSLARGFLRGMQILANGPEDGIPACQFLAGWTLESTLKSFLAHHGKDKSSLQSIQHDLAALWELAATLGLGVLTCPPDWCQSLNSIHYGPDKHHRYHSR